MRTSRRELLRVGLGGLGVVCLGGSMPAFMSQFALAESAKNPSVSNDNILVVIQLSGGNDGLNTVIPLGDDAYRKARPNIAIKDRLVKLNDKLALNPGMTAMKSLFEQGKVAIVNGVGYPKPNRSHFRSMEIWQTADPEGHDDCGWLGHYLDHALRGTNTMLGAVNIGPELPQAMIAERYMAPSIQSIDDFHIRVDSSSPQDAKKKEQIIRDLNAVKDSSPALQFLTRQATNAIIEADDIRKLTQGYKPDAEYTDQLGNQLKLIAQLISGNFGTKLFYCQIGGFDTHANQVGQQENLLRQVSMGIAALLKDLGAKGYADKVTVMCFSEFGRRVAQNNSGGTDHGAAAPMFIAGGKVKGGLYGSYPSLTDLDDGDLKFTTDFRRIYATLLDKWLNVDSTKVLRGKFDAIDLV